MVNKIYKLSIVLIFMLFSSCLFNFCFAVNGDKLEASDFTLSQTISFIGNSNGGKVNIKFVTPNFSYEPISTSNSNTTLDDSYFGDNCIYYISEGLAFFVAVPQKSDNTYWFIDGGVLRNSLTNPYVGQNTYAIYRYYFSTGEWKNTCNIEFDSSNNTVLSYCYVLDTCTADIYEYSSDGNHPIKWQGFKLPSNEELIANCDFKIDFKFNPEINDFPNDNVGSRWSWPCKLLVQHTLTNWENNYNVKIKMSVINKTQLNGLYYDLYNSNGEELSKKEHITENFLTENLNVGDFFLFFTDNLQDTFKFEYEIYNKSDELLLKKIYTFKFTKSGLTAFNSTGTIISENIQNSSGENIENGSNSFDTNGFNNTIIDNSYYDISNFDSVSNSAIETVNLTQQCFSILPNFIWVIVCTALVVAVSLRVLGR